MRTLLKSFFLLCVVMGSVGMKVYPQTRTGDRHAHSYHVDIFDVPSAFGQSYVLTVVLPHDYNNSTEKKYPVFYILDTEWNFGMVYDIYSKLQREKAVPEMILVGIGYGSSVLGRGNNRDRDMGPSFSRGVNYSSKFKDFFSKTLFPFIKDKYRSDDTRIIHGHSMGGLFLSYVLFAEPQLFDGYIISSPSWWWKGRNYIFQHEKKFMEKNKKLDARVFLSMGAKDGPEMVNPWKKMVDVLKKRNYQKLELTTTLFAGKDHHTVMDTAVHVGLHDLFKK